DDAAPLAAGGGMVAEQARYLPAALFAEYAAPQLSPWGDRFAGHISSSCDRVGHDRTTQAARESRHKTQYSPCVASRLHEVANHRPVFMFPRRQRCHNRHVRTSRQDAFAVYQQLPCVSVVLITSQR